MDATLSDPLLGQVVDERYRVVAKLARGGMATVYEAVDMRLERTVALKVMHGALAEDAEFVARFVREARSAARLSHPNVVSMFDQGTDGPLVYLVMEFVPSLNLREVLRDRGQLTVHEAFDVIEPVVAALAAAHQAGIVHRDVKPENVLLAQDGRVLVADFGLARATSTSTSATTQGVLIGTVAYLAPEQVERGIADPRSDVYAAGIVLYEMLTGAPPFAGETPLSVAYQHVNGSVPPPSETTPGVPPAVDALLAGATARDADERYSDAGRFLDALRATRERLGLPAWSAAAATSPHSLTDTLVVPRPTVNPAAVTAAAAATAGAADGVRHTAVVDRGKGEREPDEPTPRAERRRRRLRGLIVALVVLALAIGLGLYAFNVGSTKYTDTPAVVNLDRNTAIDKLREAGLTPVAGPEQFSEKTARGGVIKTVPAPGERAEVGSNVVMTISKGPERYEVPTLKGLTEADAKKAVENANLSVGEVTKVFSEKTPVGRVVNSEPGVGKELKKAAVVDLDISKGPKPIDLPSLLGKPEATATSTLSRLGLTANVADERKFSTKYPAGTVMGQTPTPGTDVPRGATVQLTISKGPEMVTMPRVLGGSVSSAKSRLEALGLKVTTKKALPGPVNLGVVYSQSPRPGSKVAKGSTVTLGYV